MKLKILRVEWINLVERCERYQREKLGGERVARKRKMRERERVCVCVFLRATV